MSGFIDPNAPLERRIERMEALLVDALRMVGTDALSPTARRVYEDLNAQDEVRQERARRFLARGMEADPLPTPTDQRESGRGGEG